MNKKLFPEERLELIYNMIKEKKKVHVNDLAKNLSISKSTTRTDLAELESRGLIKRTHGGAILQNDISVEDGRERLKSTVSIDNRIEKNYAEKEAIGALAASLVEDGDTIMIDGGSTTQFVAKNLKNKNDLTVITNSYYMLPELLPINNSAIYLAGGIAYKENAVLVGDLTNEYINHFNPQKLILGIDGVSAEYGLTVADSQVPSVASIKRKMINQCSQLIIVCDHTKIGRVCLMPIAPLKRVDYLITDSGISPEHLEEIKQAGPEVLIANI